MAHGHNRIHYHIDVMTIKLIQKAADNTIKKNT